MEDDSEVLKNNFDRGGDPCDNNFYYLLLLSMQPFVPNNYTQIVKTGGELEAKYLAMGASQVEHMEVSTEEEWGNINVYYPKELTESAKSYPVVVMVNGTGVYSSKYPALFKHLASWGFIVIGNEDPSTCSGSSADTTLAWLLNENENPDSRFYQKVDEEHIGISGHSQGGVGVFNAINEQPHGSLYTCAVSLSPTQLDLAEALNMHYEPDKTNIPVFLLAATESDVITPDGAKQLYDAVKMTKQSPCGMVWIMENALFCRWLCDGMVYVVFERRYRGRKGIHRRCTGTTQKPTVSGTAN